MANDLPGCHNSAMLRGSLLAAALLMLLGFGSGTGHVRNGRIAFEHIGEAGGGQIYAMTSSGAKRRLLTPGKGFTSRSPAYAPGGRRIVYVRAYRQSDLWLMHSDGSHQRRLTRTAGIDEVDPDWSPDGKQIAFSITRPASLKGIWVIGVDGRHRRRLTTGTDANPSWSPEGTGIAFDRYDGTTQVDNVFTAPVAGGTPTDLSTDPGISDLQPEWSPDGSRILFASDRPDTFQLDLWTMKPDGSDIRRVTNTPGRDEHDPTWSPDGRRIAYVGESSSHGASSYQLYVSRASGSSRRIITHACGECSIINDEPSWQPLR
jgi:Tol biopolymer transport system component